MSRVLIYTFSGFFFLAIHARGQEMQIADSTSVNDNVLLISKDEGMVAEYQESITEADTIVYPFFSSAALLFDYGKLTSLVMEGQSKFEVGVQFDFFNKVVLVADFGTATLEPNGAYQNAAYTSEGYYYRFGIGYKYDMNAKNNFVFTARYGRSNYSDKGVVSIQSASGIYDAFVEPFEGSVTSAVWYEAVLSSETKMWKGLYLGFHLRLRIMDSYEKREPLDVYSIPGYGRTIDKSIPALNLYIKYAFEHF